MLFTHILLKVTNHSHSCGTVLLPLATFKFLPDMACGLRKDSASILDLSLHINIFPFY